VGAFAVSSILVALAIVTLVVKSVVEWRAGAPASGVRRAAGGQA
jgi:ABC-type sulfate transport system permease subunit